MSPVKKRTKSKTRRHVSRNYISRFRLPGKNTSNLLTIGSVVAFAAMYFNKNWIAKNNTIVNYSPPPTITVGTSSGSAGSGTSSGSAGSSGTSSGSGAVTSQGTPKYTIGQVINSTTLPGWTWTINSSRYAAGWLYSGRVKAAGSSNDQAFTDVTESQLDTL